MKAAQEEGNGIMSAAWRGKLIRAGAHDLELTIDSHQFRLIAISFDSVLSTPWWL